MLGHLVERAYDFVVLQGVLASCRQEFRKNRKKFQKAKNLEKKPWKFVYILAKQYKSPFNLTNFFGNQFQNSIFTILTKKLQMTKNWKKVKQISLQFDDFFWHPISKLYFGQIFEIFNKKLQKTKNEKNRKANLPSIWRFF